MYKGKWNIWEYIMKRFNLTLKFKSRKLEIGEDLLVHLVLWVVTHKRTTGPSINIYLTLCKWKTGYRKIRLKVLTWVRLHKIRKERIIRELGKVILAK
ncbi:hypothetical protein Lal_00046988 [Lupinus albus]|nr:hypothetical protein Lal_00046988 [Lupinus albus]